MLTHADLPDDIAALKAMVLERESALATKEVMVGELLEQVSTHALEIAHLKLLIAKLKRMQFGRKSEKLEHEILQLELRLEELQLTKARCTSSSLFGGETAHPSSVSHCRRICRATFNSIYHPTLRRAPSAAPP